MRGWLLSDKAICPFYRGELDRRIRCEGVERGSIRIVFESVEERKGYGNRHCKSWHHESCVMCQALMKKYES